MTQAGNKEGWGNYDRDICAETWGKKAGRDWQKNPALMGKIHQQEMAATLTEGFLDTGAGPCTL